jgi:tetratricopeptide (TPR) repeat protein
MTDPFVQAAQALRAGRVGEAASQFETILKADPAHVGALNLLAQIRFKAGDLAAAEGLLRRAAAADPGQADTHFNLGVLLGVRGNHEQAAASHRQAAAINPGHVNALAHLAGALSATVRPGEALAAADKALALNQRHPIALNHRATALWQLGRRDEAVASARGAAAAAPEYAAAQRNLAQYLLETGHAEDAVTGFLKALALDPGNRDAEAGLAAAMRRLLPPWHFSMLSDTRRNRLYRQAIEAAVRPGMLVLDIGTGTGLLAMMAARAGAEQVVACEADAQLAEVAKEIVALNGFAQRITVIPRRSTELKAGVDLPRRADLVVSEILSANLIGEGVAPTMNHAVAELAKPGARIIPLRARVYGSLIAAPEVRLTNPIRRIEGFDLSPFERFRNKTAGVDLALALEDHALLSEPQELFAFDFTRRIEPARERGVTFTATGDGAAHAVVLWYRIDLDDERAGWTRPGGEFRHWATPLYFLDEDIAVKKGQDVALKVAHDPTTWRVWA